MSEKILPYKCKCGGILKQSKCNVEFFGIDFGIRQCEVCTGCGTEYLDEAVMEEIEHRVKEKKLFGLEHKIKITKSGNSLVVRIPPEIARFAGIHYADLATILQIRKKKLEIEMSG